MKRFNGLIHALFLSLVVLLGLPAEGIAEVQSSTAIGSEPASKLSAVVPLEEVTLFSTGLAYFHHVGYVEGSVDLEIHFPADVMKDILKSLVLQDFSGGSVEIVRYESSEPLDQQLKQYSLDLRDLSGIADLLSQTRGEEIRIEANETLSGRIVAIETLSNGRDEPVSREIHLLSEGELRRVRISRIETLRYSDPELQRELEEVLSLIAENRRRERKRLRIRFEGEGRRRVSIGFLRPVPVWKTTYRLVEEAGGYTLQAWALVENTGVDDWRDIELSLVAGTPISFIMDLYTPIRGERPSIPPPVAKSITAREYGPSYQAPSSSATGAHAPVSKMAESVVRDEMARRERDDSYGSSGVRGRGEGSDMGALFSYTIEDRLTIEGNSSAMVPILVEPVEARKVSVYSAHEGLNNPLAGIDLKNTTGAQLAAGPYTVYAEGGYAGDALASQIVPDESRLLTYAVDRDLLVLEESRGKPKRAVKMRISGGTFIYTELNRRGTLYKLTNRGAEEKRLIIEHPKSSGWKLVSPAPESSNGVTESPSAYRIERVVRDGMVLEIEEQQPISRRISLGSIDDARVEYYLQNFDMSRSLERAFERVKSYYERISRLEDSISQLESQRESIYLEQDRIRSNMSQISRDTDLYRRYMKKLREQEKLLEGLLTETEEMRKKLATARADLRSYLNGLDVDG